jgi:hypothetical protein
MPDVIPPSLLKLKLEYRLKIVGLDTIVFTLRQLAFLRTCTRFKNINRTQDWINRTPWKLMKSMKWSVNSRSTIGFCGSWLPVCFDFCSFICHIFWGFWLLAECLLASPAKMVLFCIFSWYIAGGESFSGGTVSICKDFCAFWRLFSISYCKSKQSCLKYY